MRHDHDSDIAKGAVEQEDRTPNGNSSMAGQLGHRTGNSMIKDNDSDFPEPGGNPEHSGEREQESNPEGKGQSQEPGFRQKRNQGDRKEDPLAS